MQRFFDWLRGVFGGKKLPCPYKDGYKFKKSADLVNHLLVYHPGGEISKDISLV